MELNQNENENQTEQDPPNSVRLSDRRLVTYREGTGQDLVDAMKVISDQSQLPMALSAQLAEIDGQRIVMEDLLIMKLPDVMKIQTAVMALVGN